MSGKSKFCFVRYILFQSATKKELEKSAYLKDLLKYHCICSLLISLVSIYAKLAMVQSILYHIVLV